MSIFLFFNRCFKTEMAKILINNILNYLIKNRELF